MKSFIENMINSANSYLKRKSKLDKWNVLSFNKQNDSPKVNFH